MVWWIGAPLVAALVLFLAQGFLLQISVALTGEPAPKYGHALKTALLAWLLSGLAATTWKFSIGLVVGSTVSALVYGLLLLGVTTLVYRRQLGGSTVQAFVVAVIHHLLGALLSGATWGIVNLLT